jgi:membrane protease YdiL (CAAX protease family)
MKPPFHPSLRADDAPALMPARPQGAAVWLLPAAASAALICAAAGSTRPWIVLLLFAPAVEELLFRAGLQETLLRRGLRPLVANLLATLAFALLHGLLRSWPLALAVVLPSLVLGRVYQSRRRLAPVVALHAAMNLFWIALGSRVAGRLPFDF